MLGTRKCPFFIYIIFWRVHVPGEFVYMRLKPPGPVFVKMILSEFAGCMYLPRESKVRKCGKVVGLI